MLFCEINQALLEQNLSGDNDSDNLKNILKFIIQKLSLAQVVEIICQNDTVISELLITYGDGLDHLHKEITENHPDIIKKLPEELQRKLINNER